MMFSSKICTPRVVAFVSLRAVRFNAFHDALMRRRRHYIREASLPHTRLREATHAIYVDMLHVGRRAPAAYLPPQRSRRATMSRSQRCLKIEDDGARDAAHASQPPPPHAAPRFFPPKMTTRHGAGRRRLPAER